MDINAMIIDLAATMAAQAQAIADGNVRQTYAAAMRLKDNADTLAEWTRLVEYGVPA